MDGVVMNKRTFYEKMFAEYRDLVSLKEMREMLGQLSWKKTHKLLDDGQIKYFYIRNEYRIPKVCIIDFLLGESYCAQRADAVHKYKGKRRKRGSGCLRQINDCLWEGRYSPRNAYGERVSKNVYAKTRDGCERKLYALIEKMNKEILEQKIKLMEEKYAEASIIKMIDELSQENP